MGTTEDMSYLLCQAKVGHSKAPDNWKQHIVACTTIFPGWPVDTPCASLGTNPKWQTLPHGEFLLGTSGHTTNLVSLGFRLPHHFQKRQGLEPLELPPLYAAECMLISSHFGGEKALKKQTRFCRPDECWSNCRMWNDVDGWKYEPVGWCWLTIYLLINTLNHSRSS